MKEKEENVRADCSGSGHAAEAEREKGPAILGKFRSADALAEAYSALQAEFTRRSQRLRELERKAENPEAKAGGALQTAEKPQQREPGRETEVCSESSVSRKVAARSVAAEDGRGPALSHFTSSDEEVGQPAKAGKSAGQTAEAAERAETGEQAENSGREGILAKTEGKATAEAVKSTEGAVSEERETAERARETARTLQAAPEQGDKRADDESAVPGTGQGVKTAEIGEKPEGAPEKTAGELSEEALYRAASASESVRLRIVGDYLASLKNPGAPLMRGGTGTLAAPPLKARSIDEAGTMALQYFRRGGQV